MQELAVIAEEREKKSTENQTAGEIQMQPDEKK